MVEWGLNDKPKEQNWGTNDTPVTVAAPPDPIEECENISKVVDMYDKFGIPTFEINKAYQDKVQALKGGAAALVSAFPSPFAPAIGVAVANTKQSDVVLGFMEAVSRVHREREMQREMQGSLVAKKFSVWERAKMYLTRPEPAGGWDRSDKPLRTVGKIAAVGTADIVSGLGLTIPDILAQEIFSEPTLGSAVAKGLGLERTPKEEQQSEVARYMSSLYTAGKLTRPLIAKLPMRAAIRYMFSGTVQFGTRELIAQEVANITVGEPIDWEEVNEAALWGTFFGGIEAIGSRVMRWKRYKDFIKARPEFKKFPPDLMKRMDEAAMAVKDGMPLKSWTQVYGKDAKQFTDLMRQNFGAGPTVEYEIVPTEYTKQKNAIVKSYNEGIGQARANGDTEAISALNRLRDNEFAALEKQTNDQALKEVDAEFEAMSTSGEIPELGKQGAKISEGLPMLEETPAAEKGEGISEQQFMSILQLSARSEGVLRPSDVYRVMNEAKDQGVLEPFYKRLLKGNLETRTFEQAQKIFKELSKGKTDEITKEETITEPKPSIEEQQGKARPDVSLEPTGTLDPTNAEDAKEIIDQQIQDQRGNFTPIAFSGIYKTKFDNKTKETVITEVVYSHQQVDQAYRTLQNEIESPQDDVSLFAMPGKEKELGAIAAKMAKQKKFAQTKIKDTYSGLRVKVGNAKQLPKAKTKTEDFIKAVTVASAKAESKGYGNALMGVSVEGDNLVATDGRRMFIAKGKWGVSGLYTDKTSLSKGLFGQKVKTGLSFPKWQDIVPDYSNEDAIVISPNAPNNDLPTVYRRIKQASVVTSEESSGVLVLLNKDGSLGFAASAPEVGHAEINVQPGGKILGAANPRFLMESLEYHSIRGDKQIDFYFPFPDRPIMTVGSHSSTKTIIMPVNVGEPSESLKKDLGIAEEKAGITPDPTVPDTPDGKPGFAGVAGRPSGKVDKPWLDAEKVKSPDPKMESFFQRTKRFGPEKASTLLDKIKTAYKERFELTPHLPKTPEAAFAHDVIRTMPEAVRAAKEEAFEDYRDVLDGDGSTEVLSMNGMDLFAKKTFIEDFIVEAEAGRKVPGNFTLEELQTEKIRVDDLLRNVPSVDRAYKARQALWSKLSKDLVGRGVISEENAANPHYIRHFVLEYMEKGYGAGTGKKLKDPFRAYGLGRKGTLKDVSTDILEVDTHALASIYADNAVEDAAKEIASQYGERPRFTELAKDKNFENLVGGPKNVSKIYSLRDEIAEMRQQKLDKDEREILKALVEELHELDPTWEYRQRIAIAMKRIKDSLGLDNDANISPADMNAIIRDEPESEAAFAAMGAFKAINERAQFMRAALGDKFLTPEGLAEANDFVEWHYKRPNVWYRAKTLDESKIAQLLEAGVESDLDITIPKAMLRDALVMGRKRKGWIIPKWLANQLDNLPVNTRSGYIVDSLTKPFTMFWKRWILRVNPLRYNRRNMIGDSERLNVSGRTHAFGRSGEAVKMLWNQEGEIYNQARRFGVIGTSLWHEMGTAHKQKMFDRFAKVKDVTSLEKAIRTPKEGIRLISAGGQVIQDLTQAREDILRLALFLDALDDVDAFNKGVDTRYGPHIRHWQGRYSDIEAIAKDDRWRAAAKISRETLGDYGNFSPWENDVLRQGLMPFYSWMKINASWPHVIKEAAREGAGGKAAGAAAAKMGMNLGKWAVRAMSIYAAAYVWNHRDEKSAAKDDALPLWLKSRPHINIGDGTIWEQTALSDFSEWFNSDEIAGDLQRFEAGYITFEQFLQDTAVNMAKGPAQKIYQSLNPFLKAPITAMGQRTFPDVFEPRIFAKAFSSEALKEACLEILGTDTRKFIAAREGKVTIEEAISYYLVASMYRNTSPEELEKQIKKALSYTMLKGKSPITGRRPGQAKKGKEREHELNRIRQQALKKSNE